LFNFYIFEPSSEILSSQSLVHQRILAAKTMYTYMKYKNIFHNFKQDILIRIHSSEYFFNN